MKRLGPVVALLALAALAALAWLRLPSLGPVWGAALVEAYELITGVPNTISGVDGATVAAVILSRPLMWLFLGYAVAVVIGPGRRALVISLFALVGLAAVCIVAPQAAGLFLLGFTDLSMQWGVPFVLQGGIAFVLPGVLCAIVSRLER